MTFTNKCLERNRKWVMMMTKKKNRKKNLKQFTSDQSHEEAVKNGQKGGIASGVARRKKKALKEQMELLLSLPLQDKDVKAKLRSLGIAEEEMDNQMAMIIGLWNKALKGDIQAFNSIRDLIGEKPPDTHNVNLTNPYADLSTEELRRLAQGDG